MTDQELNEVIAKQLAYSAAEKAGTHAVRSDKAALRKAWLKQRFASFDYHELMLRLHEKWLDLIYTALARPDVKENHPAHYKFFMGPAKENFDKAPKPGRLDRKYWEPGRQTGWARAISDYNRDSSLDVMTTWEWLTTEEEGNIFPLWGYMSQMAQNIQYTVDGVWDSDPTNNDWILDEYSTGIVDWPTNWMNELPPEVLSAAQSQPLTQRHNVRAGLPCPEAGWWHTPARQSSRRWFKQGEIMPDTGGDYGQTFWQWSPNQSAPTL